MKESKQKSVAQEIIDRSGNSFHVRVVKRLRDLGWDVLISPHYSDNFTDKPREIDIIAEKRFDVKEFISDWIGTLNVRLVIECKYVDSNTVFWLDDKDTERAVARVMRDTSMEHPRKNTTIQSHHYLAEVPVAKLFASESKRGEEHEAISKAINQSLNATVYYRSKNDLKLALPPAGYVDRVLKRITYPLIVVDSFDKLHAANMNGEGQPVTITEPFPLEVNYAYTDKDRNAHNEYFLIDVVSIEKLESFLSDVIGKDVQTVSQKLQWDSRTNRSQERSGGGGIFDETF